MNTRLIDFSAIENLCNEDREIMLYDFYIVLDSYITQVDMLSELLKAHFNVYTYSNAPNNKHAIFFDGAILKADCKTTLTNLLIYNYQQIKAGKPIIPLIFIIGSETQDFQLRFDPKQAALSSNDFDISNSELRRCFKMVTESTGDLKNVAEQTFNFFVLKDNSKAKNFTEWLFSFIFPKKNADTLEPKAFSLVQVPAPWNSSEFTAAWQKRTSNPDRSSQGKDKPFLWRKQLAEKISIIDSSATVFKRKKSPRKSGVTENKVQSSQQYHQTGVFRPHH